MDRRTVDNVFVELPMEEQTAAIAGLIRRIDGVGSSTAQLEGSWHVFHWRR
jgi:hypothetical protein